METPPHEASVPMSLPAFFIRKVFKMHGEFCASQPWEVIVWVFILLVSSITLCSNHLATFSTIVNNMEAVGEERLENPRHELTTNREWLQTGLLLTMSVLAILRLTYSFRKIHTLGSNFLWKTAFCYLFFTYSLFSFVMWSLNCQPLQSWFLLPLLADMQKVTRMAQFTLSSSHLSRISENVANGMYVLAPAFSLDTLTKLLLISLGFLAPIPQLQLYALHATVLVLINWLVYMSFYPSGLALFLELMYCADGRPSWDVRQIINTLPNEEGQSPTVHRVKVVAAALMIVVHLFCRTNVLDVHFWANGPMGFIAAKWDMLAVAGLIMFFSGKYLYYDDTDEARELRRTYIAELTRKFAEDNGLDKVIINTNNNVHHNGNSSNQNNNADLDQFSNSTDEGISSLDAKMMTKRNSSSNMRRVNDDSCSDSSNWSEIGPFISSSHHVSQHSLQQQLAQPLLSKDQMSQTDFDATDLRHNGAMQQADTPEATESSVAVIGNNQEGEEERPSQSLETCVALSKQVDGLLSLTDSELVMLIENKVLRAHALEKVLKGDHVRAVRVRRHVVQRQSGHQLHHVPYKNYHYDTVMGACCESVIGYMTLPIGVVGPLVVDGQSYLVPMVTTEGCLVASVNRGCSALRQGGVSSVLINDSMTRAPVVRFETIEDLKDALEWIRDKSHFQELKTVFDNTSRFARLQCIEPRVAGRDLYLRFVATTGDAMGMNMVSKASEQALAKLKLVFPSMKVLGLSGNVCTDKKSSAINWIQGRGKSVVCEATVPAAVVESVLKTSPAAMVALNEAKNLVGSSLAGSIGGSNAQAANVVTAIFIATGQDVAQNVCSSQCLTQMSVLEDGELSITCTMPSIEVGTVGGGTILPAQANCLEMMGVRGPHPTHPGNNARQLAKIICASVLAGELSLTAALVTGDLVVSHLRHNRSNLAQVLAKQQQLLTNSNKNNKS